MKEIRLYYSFTEVTHPRSKSKIKAKEDSREKKKGANARKMEKEDAKKQKRPRPRRRESFALDPELLVAQKHYFQIVEEIKEQTCI